MLRLRGRRPDGREFLLLGLDKENIRRLTDKKPIWIKGETVQMEFDVLIMYGETLQDVTDDLAKRGLNMTVKGEKPQA